MSIGLCLGKIGEHINILHATVLGGCESCQRLNYYKMFTATVQSTCLSQPSSFLSLGLPSL
jgi:hypothetical protein